MLIHALKVFHKVPEKFWVLPCLELAFSYVVYRENSREILVEVRDGRLTAMAEALTYYEKLYFDRNILTQ